MNRKTAFFVALGIGVASLAVGYKIWVDGVEAVAFDHSAPISVRPLR